MSVITEYCFSLNCGEFLDWGKKKGGTEGNYLIILSLNNLEH